MNYLENFFSDEIIRALGWTILHSLWQGTMVALVLALLMVFLYKHSSTVRYFISATALVTVLVLSVVTFLGLYNTLQQPFEYTGTDAAIIRTIPNISGGYTFYEAPTEEQTFWGTLTAFVDYFNQHLPLIVTIWMMGVAVLALRFLGGLAYVQRLKSYRTQLLPEVWEKRMKNIARKLDIRQKIKLLESSMVKVPMVIGHLKPVILLPVGTVTGLSVKQVEAILAHELAHIARNDYLINIFQSVIDIVFFYHPAVWWISANVRSERENCCDDIAVSINADSMAFARALTEMQQIDYRAPGFAMAATGKKGQLFQRVKRLVEAHQKNPTFKEGFIAACVLMISILSLSFSADADYDTAQQQKEAKEIWVAAEESPQPEKEFAPAMDSAEKAPASIASIDVSVPEVEQVEVDEEAEINAAWEAEEAEMEGFTISGSRSSASARASTGRIPRTEAHGWARAGSWPQVVFEQAENGNTFDFESLTYRGVGSPLQFNLYDTTRKENVTVVSATLEDGRYFFARLNAENEIIELFVEGRKIPESEYGEYEKEVKKHLRFVDEEARIRQQRERMLEMEERTKLREKQRSLRQLQQQLKMQERITQQNLERMEREGVFEDMEDLEKNMREAMERQQVELEKLQKELEKATETLENDSLLRNSYPTGLWINGSRISVPQSDARGFVLRSPRSGGVMVAPDIFCDTTRIIVDGHVISENVMGRLKNFEITTDGVTGNGFSWTTPDNSWRFSWDSNLVDALKKEFKKDGFPTKGYKFDINEKRLKINGKKQSDELYKKYKKLIEKQTGEKLSDSFQYVFND